ncbi:MAG: biotin/lipoyl-containing protein, partial [Bdellovibrionota bacterium]
MKYVIQKDGKPIEFFAEKIGNDVWISYKGKVHSVTSNPAQVRQNKSGSRSNPDLVIAPMPGKITKVMVRAGSKVNSGDVVVVMEAMKMEYTLKAEKTAEVKSLNIKEGD